VALPWSTSGPPPAAAAAVAQAPVASTMLVAWAAKLRFVFPPRVGSLQLVPVCTRRVEPKSNER
jgi:hypothetical protein